MNNKGYNVNYPDNYNIRFGNLASSDPQSRQAMVELLAGKSSGLISPQGIDIDSYNKARGTNHTFEDFTKDNELQKLFGEYAKEKSKEKKYNIDVMDRLRTQRYSKKGPFKNISNVLKLNKALKDNTQTLGHELTHLNQKMERPDILKDYVRPEDDKKAYRKHPSEVEARKVGSEVKKGVSGLIDPVVKDSFKDAVKERYPKLHNVFFGNKDVNDDNNLQETIEFLRRK
jgi:hypothetical protein